MSCCGSCARGGKCRGNPTPTFGPRRRIRFLDYRGQVRTGTTVMRAAGGNGWVVNLGGRYGTPAVVPDSAILASARLKRRNPNFLYMTNRRGRKRRNGGASQNFIYEANGRRKNKRRLPARTRLGRFKKRR